MNTSYIISLIFSFLFLSPLPKVDKGILIARFEVFAQPETRQITIEATYDTACFPDDCAALLLLMEYGEDICSEEELKRFIKQTKIDTLPKSF